MGMGCVYIPVFSSLTHAKFVNGNHSLPRCVGLSLFSLPSLFLALNVSFSWRQRGNTFIDQYLLRDSALPGKTVRFKEVQGRQLCEKQTGSFQHTKCSRVREKIEWTEQNLLRLFSRLLRHLLFLFSILLCSVDTHLVHHHERLYTLRVRFRCRSLSLLLLFLLISLPCAVLFPSKRLSVSLLLLSVSWFSVKETEGEMQQYKLLSSREAKTRRETRRETRKEVSPWETTPFRSCFTVRHSTASVIGRCFIHRVFSCSP